MENPQLLDLILHGVAALLPGLFMAAAGVVRGGILLTGLIVAALRGYLVEVMSLGLLGAGYTPQYSFIGIGMWLALIMAFNVWFVIWPNQQKALGMVEASDDEKAAAARTAMLFSRTNTLLSIPMLFCMVGAQNLFVIS